MKQPVLFAMTTTSVRFVPVRTYPRKVPTARKGSTTMGCVSWHLRCREQVFTSRNDLKLLAKDILRCQVKIPLFKESKVIHQIKAKDKTINRKQSADGMKN